MADDFERIRDIFTAARKSNTIVTIPPGDYFLDGLKPIQLDSNTTVNA